MQAHTIYANNIAYTHDDILTLSQFIPAEISTEANGRPVNLRLEADLQRQQAHRPGSLAYTLQITSEHPNDFTLRIRLPWWLSGAPCVMLNGEPIAADCAPSSYLDIRRGWQSDTLWLELPKTLVSIPLPDEPNLVAFMDGPVVLAALNPGWTVSKAQTRRDGGHVARPNYAIDSLSLKGDISRPESILTPDNEREWGYWRGDYRTFGQAQDLRLIPLHEVRDEVYSIYLSVET